MGIALKKVAKRWMKEPGFREGYEALEEEFSVTSLLIEARTRSHLTQAELAERMGTSQSAIAAWRAGRPSPPSPR